MHIIDPNRLLPNLFLFMPMWEMTLKKCKNHRSLLLHSEKVEGVNEIKIKSKNMKVFNLWYKHIGEAKETMLLNVKIRFANHALRLNKDGAFIFAKYQMNNDSVKIIVNEKVIIDIPRYPESWAAPNLNDLEKVHLYRGEHMVATIKCKNPLQALKVVVEMNVLPEDLETQPTIEVDKIVVPELDDSMFDNTSGSSTFSSNVNMMAVDSESEDESGKKKKNKGQEGTIPLKETSNKKKKKKKVNPQDTYSFANQMREKMEKINELPRNEKKPDPQELIKQITSQFKFNVEPGKAPQINIPDNYNVPESSSSSSHSEEEDIPILNPIENSNLSDENDLNNHTIENDQNIANKQSNKPRKFKISKDDPFASSLFRESIAMNYEEPININSVYNTQKVFEDFSEDIKEKLTDADIKPINEDKNQFKLIFDKLDSLSPDELPEFATGVFLNGRVYGLQEHVKKLLDVDFGILRIKEIINNAHITNKLGFYNFFFQIYKESLAEIFFKGLLYNPDFRMLCYFSDAILREDKSCELLANSAKQVTKLIKKPSIPYKLTVSPYIMLRNAIPEFERNMTMYWISTPNETSRPTPFTIIIGSIITLLSKTLSDKDCRYIIYHNQIEILWNKILKLESSFNQDIEKYFTFKNKMHRSNKLVYFLVNLLVKNKISDFLITFMNESNPSEEVKQEFILCLSQILRLSKSFTKNCLKDANIYKQTTSDLGKLFNRDPINPKKQNNKKQTALEKIVDQAKEKVQEVATVVNDTAQSTVENATNAINEKALGVMQQMNVG